MLIAEHACWQSQSLWAVCGYSFNYIWRDYRNKFGGNTSQYTLLSGRTILQFESVINDAVNIQ